MEIRFRDEIRQAVCSVINALEDQTLHPKGSSATSKVRLSSLPVVKAYLVVTVSRNANFTISDIFKWKIALNEVIISREFKPHIDTVIDGKVAQSLFVYDVSMALSPETNLRIGYEGRDRLKLEAATLIILYGYEASDTYLECVGKAAQLGCLSLTLGTPSINDVRNANLYSGIIAERANKLMIGFSSNGAQGSIEGRLSPGFNLLEIVLPHVCRSVEYRGGSEGGAPSRHVFTCAVVTNLKLPEINVRKAGIADDVLNIELSNVGEGSAEHMEVLVLRCGQPLQRVQVGTLKPGEVKELVARIPGIPKPGIYVVRVMWRKACRTFYKDVILRHQVP